MLPACRPALAIVTRRSAAFWTNIPKACLWSIYNVKSDLDPPTGRPYQPLLLQGTASNCGSYPTHPNRPVLEGRFFLNPSGKTPHATFPTRCWTSLWRDIMTVIAHRRESYCDPHMLRPFADVIAWRLMTGYSGMLKGTDSAFGGMSSPPQAEHPITDVGDFRTDVPPHRVWCWCIMAVRRLSDRRCWRGVMTIPTTPIMIEYLVRTETTITLNYPL
ncbi:hypothetical protein RSAG8_01689, partial [Rhizoctonia solani AG-8 WAC10335]